jgi:hypothetical protein
MLRTFFPFINFENPLYFLVGKGGLGAALPDQLGSQDFTWLSIYQKRMGIAWVLIHTKSMCFLSPPTPHLPPPPFECTILTKLFFCHSKSISNIYQRSLPTQNDSIGEVYLAWLELVTVLIRTFLQQLVLL